jgi:hypothetical protein
MSGVQPGTTVVVDVAASVSLTGSEASFSWICPTVDFDGPVYSYMVKRRHVPPFVPF